MGNYEVIPANTRVNVTFDVEMSGSGSAGTAPKYGAILKACGLSETTVTSNLLLMHLLQPHQTALHYLLTMMALDIWLQVLEVHSVLTVK